MRICHEDIHSQDYFHNFECLVHFWSLMNGHLTFFIRDWQEQMCLFGPHKLISINSTMEILHFPDVAWWKKQKMKEM